MFPLFVFSCGRIYIIHSDNNVVITDDSMVISGKEYKNEKELEELLITAEQIDTENRKILSK